MKRLLSLLLVFVMTAALLLVSLPAAQAAAVPSFEVVKLVDNGPDDECAVLTIMGDGFTASEQDAFMEMARNVSDGVLNFYPYNQFKINVYAIKVISNESGMAPDQYVTAVAPGLVQLIDNYFGGFLSHANVTNDNTVDIFYYNKVWELLDAYGLRRDMPVVLCNTTEYVGSTSHGVVSSAINPDAPNIVIHEIGHVFGLNDEYDQHVSTPDVVSGFLDVFERQNPNSTYQSDPASVKWRHWIGYEGIGINRCSEASDGSILYTPRSRVFNPCRMASNTRTFCMVCASHIIGKMAAIVGEPFYGLSNVESIPVPNGTSRLLDAAFNGCERLQAVSIPESVISIGRYAFIGCEALETFVNLSATPQTLDSTVFASVALANVTLYIPEGTSAAYTAAGWTGFGDIVEFDPASPPVVPDSTIPVPPEVHGIDYSQPDLIVPGRGAEGFEINLTQETLTIPSTYTPVVYRTNGGKWKPVKDALSAAKFPKLFNKDLELELSDKPVEKQTGNPQEGAVIVTFPTILKRPKAPALTVNYAIGADPTGATPGDFVLTTQGGTSAAHGGIQIGVASGKTADENGFGHFYPDCGIAIKPLTSATPAKAVYYIRTAPVQKSGIVTTYMAAGKPKKITVKGEQKAPKYKVNVKGETKSKPASEVIKVKANTYVTMNGDTKLYTAKADLNVLGYVGTIELWTAATAKKPASAKQSIAWR